MEIDLQRYRDFRPTAFDARGLNADRFDIGDFFVAPCSRTRDSGCLERSNFRCLLRELGGQSDTVQVHRFGHWGPGWFELILIDPADETAVRVAQETANALTDYPIVDESDFSELEWEEACEYWERASIRERVDLLHDTGVSVFAARRDELPQDDNGRLFERLTREG